MKAFSPNTVTPPHPLVNSFTDLGVGLNEMMALIPDTPHD